MTDCSCGCCGGSDCCTPGGEKKNLVIDFLYLDLGVCTRCQGTEKSLDDAITEVSGVLKVGRF